MNDFLDKLSGFFKNLFSKIASAYQQQKQLAIQEQKRKEIEELKQVIISLVNFWLLYVDKIMKLKMYQGEYPIIEENAGKLTFLQNVDLHDGFERQYNDYATHCIDDFVSCLQKELLEIERTVREEEQKYSDLGCKIISYENQVKIIENKKNIEPKHIDQVRLEREKQRYLNDILQLENQRQNIFNNCMSLQTKYKKISSVLNYLCSKNVSLTGYSNKQINHPLFVIEVF